MPKLPLSFVEYKLMSEVRVYVTSSKSRCALAAAWLDIAYTFDAIEDRRIEEERRLNRSTAKHLQREPARNPLHDPRNATFKRLTKFVTDAIAWDLSLFSDAGRSLHAHAILYVHWLITDPEAHLRGLGFTSMERDDFPAATSDAVAPKRPIRDDWYLDRNWVRMTVFRTETGYREPWLRQVQIALYEVSLPAPKRRAVRPADLRAAHSYLWAINADASLVSRDGSRFTKKQHAYVCSNDNAMYRCAKPPKFTTWRTQASRGFPILTAVGGGTDLERAARAALDEDEDRDDR